MRDTRLSWPSIFAIGVSLGFKEYVEFITISQLKYLIYKTCITKTQTDSITQTWCFRLVSFQATGPQEFVHAVVVTPPLWRG